ncbi:mitotic checkpoint serine/threonine-protein kinase BUB1 beta-like [Sinocyclocheilus rhinocerous]|uniref:mitotic checkpoint serine/threonine-protein kinase BUB1 beta-like n=1 Tax=Sinocyclocheilus rhinocerous TaxID=307959 RepID=UPI0007BACC9C|nr:PREDICTED: mitotic checkpoint serine/threonine-protein kinase BUB1 beta-like [Sinocyclocheilus rhinocerous]
MAECDAEWELCKENIQPLRQGRSVSALQQALCQQQEGNHTALHQKTQAFESELRLYDGDDPLDVWVRYIKWTKQATTEIYIISCQYLLYLLISRALQARACRQMMTSMTDQHREDDDDDDEGPAEPQRSSLFELKAKGKKKAVVPINRVKASAGYARGLQFKQPLGPKQNSRLVIFDENKASETETQEPKFEVWTAPPTARAKENEQKPEKWTDVKLPLKSRSGLSVAVAPPKPSFQPFVEEDDQPPAVTPCKIDPAVNSVLSVRKPCRPEQTPLKMLQELQTQEDGTSREQSMYCRELLYSGASEFCFEELRAERYRQKHAVKLQSTESQ